MRIAIATAHVPFVSGGAEAHAKRLCEELNRAGHEAEIIWIPYRWYPPQLILDHLMACRLFNLESSSGKDIDLCIGLKFPAYHVRHPNKVLWILHQHRTAYDLWDKPESDLGKLADGREIRDVIRAADTRLMEEARAIFTNSLNVARRLRAFNGIQGQALYHPPPLADAHHCAGDAGFLFYPSRICGMKRQHLVLEALRHCDAAVRVRFSGAVDEEKYYQRLLAYVEKHGLQNRVEFMGHLSKQEFLDTYAICRAVLYTPLDEDYGYVTLEAMLSSKPVVTLSDSGGSLEFVDEDSGWVAEPTPETLGATLQETWADASRCAEKGRAGLQRYRDLNISWAAAIDRLIQ